MLVTDIDGAGDELKTKPVADDGGAEEKVVVVRTSQSPSPDAKDG